MKLAAAANFIIGGGLFILSGQAIIGVEAQVSSIVCHYRGGGLITAASINVICARKWKHHSHKPLSTLFK